MSEIDEKEIKQRFEAISKFEINPEVTARDLEQTRKSLAGKISTKQPAELKIWSIIMKSNITKLAAAAVIIIAALIVIHYSGSSIDGTSVAWADVIEQISNFRPYACTYTVFDEGTLVRSYRSMRFSLTQRREIRFDGTILVYDLAIPKLLTIVPEKKYAIERILDAQPTTDPDIFKMADSMQNISSGGVQELGIREIDGHIAKGFRSKSEYNDITIWADVQTKLPVQLEIIHVGRGKKIIISEFEFDIDFDEALFSTTAPEGYTVEKLDKREVTELTKFKRSTTEKDLIEGLRALAIFLDGRFPPKIELDELRETLKGYIAQNNLSDSEIEERLAPVSEKWTKAYWYTMLLKGEMEAGDFHYAGDGVELGDSDTPVIWWLPKDSKTYRVIYGDLSVKDVAPENLSE